MYKKDKIRAITAVTLFSVIGIAYYFEGKSNFTRTVVAIAAAIWLFTMWYLRKKFNENQ